MFAFRGQFDNRFVHHRLDWDSPRCARATLFQLLDALPSPPDFLAQLTVGGLEAPHRPALLLQVGQRLQTVFGLESIQLGVSLTEAGVQGGPGRVGNFARGVIRHRVVFDQRIQRIFLTQILEKVLLLTQ